MRWPGAEKAIMRLRAGSRRRDAGMVINALEVFLD
jgi:hypothetical protein